MEMIKLKLWKNAQEAIPSSLGLALVGLYVGTALVLGGVSILSNRSHLAERERQGIERRIFWQARAVARAMWGGGLNAATQELRRGKQETGVSHCEIADLDARIIASTDPARVGAELDEDSAAGLIGISDLEAMPLMTGSKPRTTTYAIRLGRIPAAMTHKPASGSPRIGEPSATAPVTPAWLLVESRLDETGSSAVAWWSTTGYVLLAGMGCFWILYRLVTRKLRPLTAIRARLLGTGNHIAEKLNTLRVNDSLDQVGSAWNRLIEFANEMQEEIRSAQLRSAVEGTLEAYRSGQLATVLRQMPQGVLVLDDNQHVSFVNPSAGRLLGASEGELAGRPAKDILPESVQVNLLKATGESSRWVDHAIEGKDGCTTIRFTRTKVEKESQFNGTVVIIQDVSQFKEVERAQEAFLHNVTHELRTPLTNIRAYAETLSEGILDDPASLRECYNVISGETERLARLIEAILNVSQLEVGAARLQVGEVYVDRMLRDAVQDMQAQADAKGIDLRLRLPSKVPVVHGDKERLSAVMANLVGNAIKYTLPKGSVEITCGADSDPGNAGEEKMLRISVSDTGIGIAPENQEKVFDKFYRVDDRRVAAEPGTGLGLAIVRETIRAHGGNVALESTLGRGSTFHIMLPTARQG